MICKLTPFSATKSKLAKLNHEHKDLKEKLKEERKQVEELWKIKAELEDERRVQDRSMEQLQRKVRGGECPAFRSYGRFQHFSPTRNMQSPMRSAEMCDNLRVFDCL